MKKLLKTGIAAFLVVLTVSYTGCSSDDSGSGQEPVITSVAAAMNADWEPSDLEPITQAMADNMVIIRGSGFATLQKIFFNGTDTYFNPTLVTDTEIFVQIDRNTPFQDQSDEVRLVTKYGEATYSFIVAPPAPGIHSFNPVNAADGSEITIYGSFFLDPVVMIGDSEATVVSSTLTEIKAIVPAGSQHKRVSVSTISGTATYDTRIGTAIYDDGWYGGWNVQSWQTNFSYETNSNAAQGQTYIKTTMDGWGNLQLEWTWDDQIAAYDGVKVWLRADNPGKIQFIFNGNWSDTAPSLDVTTEWKEYKLSWEQLGGNVTQVQNITFKNNIGDANAYYIDNIGYYID